MPRGQALNLKASRPNYARALLSLWQTTEMDAGQQLDVYTRVLSVAQHILHSDRASIWLLEQQTTGASLVCVCATDEKLHQQAVSLAQVPTYWQHLKSHPILSCDHALNVLPQHAQMMKEVSPYLADHQAMLHVRLMSNGQMLGVLRLERLAAHHWMEDEKTFAALLAEQIVHEYEHESRAQMQQELELISRVFTASRDAIVVLSNTGLVQKVNPAFTQITGFEAAEIVGQHYPSWVNAGGQTGVDFVEMCHLVSLSGHWQGELMQRRKGRESQAVWQTMLAVTDAQGKTTHFIAIESDLSGFKEAQARVHYLSHYDSLTGLANRIELLEQLVHLITIAQSSGDQVAVFCVDVDDFKKVNLSLGHTLGDQLLTIIASRLSALGDAHGVWARLSADEFIYAVSLGHAQPVEPMMMAFLDALHQPFALGGQQLRLTASLGSAIYPQDAHDAESLLRSAQTAMRAMKHLGGNGYQCYLPTMNNQAIERLLLENQLARAVSNHELVLHYQPQVSLEDGQLVGVEALVRWQHPNLGLVSPGVFIPLAEETGLIEEIGDWVLAEACRQLAEWRDQGLPVVTMAVNISAPQFVRRPIVQHIASLIEQYHLPPNLVELELTERVVMNDPSHVRDVMEQLAALGVQLSMDDFGTGYSSLSYLQKFPLDKLKVDMSFVRNIATSKDDLAITKAIIQLGRSLELCVIAEGVETLEQKRLLTSVGCHQGQGYYFAKPLPADKVVGLLKHPLTLAQGVLI